MRASALALLAAAGTAAAEPRGGASAELRMHVGDTEQDEVVHPGLFPSLVLGGGYRLTDDIEVAAAFAAAKISATWENIGGLANGFVEGKWATTVGDVRLVIGAGVAFPLDYSIPAADCFMPEKPGGDSLVLDFGTNTACWDRSAYRRAAIHRGGWNMWLWAPDWITGVASVRAERRPGPWRITADVGAGLAFAVTDAHEGERAIIVQAAGEVGYAVSTRWTLGIRSVIAGVSLDDESPVLMSFEPFAQVVGSPLWQLRFSLLIPLSDQSNDDVPPGLGGYNPSENVSIGVTGVVTIDR
ncbi:MAG: hypothetical protein H0T46_33120 [Deltaproteobacteria bacterium]|nr:hypothetical protein [Deltaproteobacteria bacterium]